MTRKFIYTLFLICVTSFYTKAQVAINSDGTSPDASAMLDVTSIRKGILIPRMTTSEREAISSPATGLLVYDTDENFFWYYNGTTWSEVGKAGFTSENSITHSNNNDDDFVFGADSLNYGSGDEYKFFFDKSTGAFRAGMIKNTDWDESNLGYYSAAFGQNNNVSGDESFATGADNNVSGDISFAFGEDNSVSDDYSAAFGENNNISSAYSTAFGSDNTINGEYSFTTGDNNTISGEYANALGRYLEVPSYGEVAIGFYNTTYTANDVNSYNSSDRLFVIGNGLTSFSRSDAMVIYKNGDTELNGKLTVADTLSIKDAYRFPMTDGNASQILTTDGNGTLSWIDNTDNQALSLATNTLTLDNGGSVDLSSYLDNTDNQALSLATNTLTLDNGGSVDLSSYLDNTDNQALSLATNTLILDNGGSVDLSSYLDNTDNQALSLATNTLTLDNGGSVDLSSYLDNTDNQAFDVFTISNDSLQVSLENDGNDTYGVDLSTISPLSLSDADDDTKIQVEESSDEDVIRFDLGGTEFFRLDNGQIEVLNTGYSLFLGLEAGENDDLSDNRNIFIGQYSGHDNTSGARNTFIGNSTGYKNNGNQNAFVGYLAGYSNTADYNVFVGGYSGYNNSSGYRNTLLGNGAGYNNSTGYENLFIGYETGILNTTGYGNTYLGSEAGRKSTGDKNIFLGYQAGYNETGSNKLYIENSSADSTSALIYGEFDNDFLQINGTLNINGNYSLPTEDGDSLQILMTNGDSTASWSYLSLLSDTDNDTKIQVEESSDEDIIRFDLGGTEFMRLDNGKIEILNTGNSIFIGEGAGENDDYSSNNNVFIGYQSGYSSTTGYENIFIGHQAGYYHKTGYSNVFFGTNAGYKNETGSDNVFLGRSTGYNSTGSDNVFLGRGAGFNNTGSDNVFLGRSAGFNESGSNKLYIENSNSSSPLIYGEFDNDFLQINGTLNINGNYNFPTTDGDSLQILTTDGNGTLSWTTKNDTLLTDADGDTKIQVEESSDEDIIRFDLGGTEFMRLDNGRIEVLNTGNSVFIGKEAGENDDFSTNKNAFIGHQSGYSNTSGEENTFLGNKSGYSNTTGEKNTFISSLAGYSNTNGSQNIFIGRSTGYNNDTGSDNVYLGRGAGFNNETGSSNVFLGYQAGYDEMNSNRLYIENSNSSSPLIYGEFDNDFLQINGNLAITGGFTDSDNDTKIQVEESNDEDIIRFDLGGTEFMRLDNGRIEVLNTGSSVFIGEGAGANDDFSDNENTFIGYESGYDNTTGEYNTFIGRRAGYNNETGLANVFLGNTSGNDNTTGSHNVFLGRSAGYSNTTGGYNTFIGRLAGYSNTTGEKSVFLGYQAGYNETNSNRLYIENSTSSSPLIYGEFDNDFLQINGNLAITGGFTDSDNDTKIQVEESSDEDIIRFDLGGTEFLRLENGRIEVFNTGNSVFLGENAGQNDDLSNNLNIAIGGYALKTNTSGQANMAIGTYSLQNSTGDFNAAIGYGSGINTTTGNNNVFIGYSAGYNITTGSNNVMIGNYAGGTTNVSDKLFIDNSDTDSPLIWGDFGNNRAVINGNSGDNSNNRTLFVNGSIGATSAFNNDSDRRLKENIQTIPNALNKVLEMRGVTYQWKDRREAGDRMGFIAQEVEPILPEVVDNENDHYTMQYAAITAVLVEAIKEQQQEINELKVQLETLTNKK